MFYIWSEVFCTGCTEEQFFDILKQAYLFCSINSDYEVVEVHTEFATIYRFDGPHAYSTLVSVHDPNYVLPEGIKK